MTTYSPEAGDGARDGLRVVINVETLVDGLRNGLDLGAKVAFDVVQVKPVIPVDQVDSQTQMTVAAGPTDTMKVGLGVLGEVKVDHNVDSLNVDTTSQEIRAH